MDNNQLRGLQELEKEMLIAFMGICKKYDLRYYMLGGTCLGAVRHQGFIPWDDDIDVAMPRKDYQTFLQVAQAELPEHLFLQHSGSDPNYPLNYAKIRNCNTAFVEASAAHISMNHGIFMDVFVLDGYKPTRLFRLKRFFYERIVSTVFTRKEKLPALWATVDFLLKHLFDYRMARDRLTRLYQKDDYDTSAMVMNFCGAWGDKEIVPRAFFGQGTPGAFEGLDVVLPAQYDAYLTQLYGDYMTPPPKEKQISHHGTDVIDLTRPYTDYTEDK